MIPGSRDSEERNEGSAERSLRLLAYLAEQGKPLSLADLAAGISLPKATTHRLCANLQAGGYLARDVNEREFAVGPALRKLALDVLNHGTFQGLRRRVLTDLVDEIGETCNFTTLDGAAVLYLDRVESERRPWRLTLDVGARVPLHCTASGKLFLALMAREQRQSLLQHLPLPALTSHTLTTAEALRSECEAIAAAGHSFDREEFITGLVAVAVPVRDRSGQIRATIAMHGPTTNISLEDATAKLPALLAASQRMERLLFADAANS